MRPECTAARVLEVRVSRQIVGGGFSSSWRFPAAAEEWPDVAQHFAIVETIHFLMLLSEQASVELG